MTKSSPSFSHGAYKVSPSSRRTSEFSSRSCLISSSESESKRSTLESSSTSSSSRIVGCSSLIRANPLCCCYTCIFYTKIVEKSRGSEWGRLKFLELRYGEVRRIPLSRRWVRSVGWWPGVQRKDLASTTEVISRWLT